MENGSNLTSLPAALWPRFVKAKGFMDPGTWATLSLFWIYLGREELWQSGCEKVARTHGSAQSGRRLNQAGRAFSKPFKRFYVSHRQEPRQEPRLGYTCPKRC